MVEVLKDRRPFERVQSISRNPHSNFLIWLVLILTMGAVLRFYRISDLMIFMGDNARDSTIVRDALTKHAFPLTGPRSFYGSFLRGPAYYYLLIPAFWLGQQNAVSGAVLVATLDLGTVLFLFLLGRKFMNATAGLFSAALYSCASYPVFLGRLFHNPSPIPFFVLLILFCLTRLNAGFSQYLILLLPAFSIAWQLHDEVLILLPGLLLSLLLIRPRVSLSTIGLSLVTTIFTLVPFLLYEVKHELVNLRTMARYLYGSQTSTFSLSHSWQQLASTTEILRRALPGSRYIQLTLLFFVFLGFLGLIIESLRNLAGSKELQNERWLLLVYALAVAFYAFWPGPVGILYLIAIIPIPFLLLGVAAGWILRRYRQLAPPLVCIITIFVVFEAVNEFRFYNQRQPGLDALPKWKHETYGAISGTVDSIIAGSGRRSFNFSLVSYAAGMEAYDQTYKYLFWFRGKEPVESLMADESFIVYDPATLDDANRPGLLNYGIKIVRGKWTIDSGNILDSSGSRWYLLKQYGRLENNESEQTVVLTGNRDDFDGLNATHALTVQPGNDYAISFQYRNQIKEGAQRIFFIVCDKNMNPLRTFPTIYGYQLGVSRDWSDGLLFVRVPETGVRAILILRNRGIGEAWFRDIQVRLVRFHPAEDQLVNLFSFNLVR